MRFLGGIKGQVEFWQRKGQLFSYTKNTNEWRVMNLDPIVPGHMHNDLCAARRYSFDMQTHRGDVQQAFIEWFDAYKQAAQDMLGGKDETQPYERAPTVKLVPPILPVPPNAPTLIFKSENDLKKEKGKLGVVYKTVLHIKHEPQDVNVKEGSRFIYFAIQHGLPTLWYICDPDAPETKFKMVLRNTQRDFDKAEEGDYIGSVQVPSNYASSLGDRELVLHLFNLGLV